MFLNLNRILAFYAKVITEIRPKPATKYAVHNLENYYFLNNSGILMYMFMRKEQ